MFSESSTGSWAELQLPCCPSKQVELPKKLLQNLLHNLPPQTVHIEQVLHKVLLVKPVLASSQLKLSDGEETFCLLTRYSILAKKNGEVAAKSLILSTEANRQSRFCARADERWFFILTFTLSSLSSALSS